ncbi:hypothetical protein ZHAS_00010301 [Anopheles sinensis]|uniref:Uncharacterized protein n=1 Tax=Anopheles sinensis TaxID=74873 RepID=A0A084VX90_ANOSI|nr:hypothetical protein ZHAS_00010301 [Anopheles sinensis]
MDSRNSNILDSDEEDDFDQANFRATVELRDDSRVFLTGLPPLQPRPVDYDRSLDSEDVIELSSDEEAPSTSRSAADYAAGQPSTSGASATYPQQASAVYIIELSSDEEAPSTSRSAADYAAGQPSTSGVETGGPDQASAADAVTLSSDEEDPPPPSFGNGNASSPQTSNRGPMLTLDSPGNTNQATSRQSVANSGTTNTPTLATANISDREYSQFESSMSYLLAKSVFRDQDCIHHLWTRLL